MFNSKLLKAKLIEKGISVLQICEEINVCETTYYIEKWQEMGTFRVVKFKLYQICYL